MTNRADEDERFMARALELASRGEGRVEPNPMVGCVLVQDGRIIAEGWHDEFGGPHAEIVALQNTGPQAVGSTAYVTLEPCSHQGKTPPCSKALIHAKVARVVAAMEDPFPPVDGSGIEELKAAGIECSIGTLGDQARQLNAPYLKRLLTGRPWVVAKWAQTSDGRLAMADGSRWISNERSREVVQQLRGRVDAVIVGSETARLDDPMLTARPTEPNDQRRTAVRIVVDSVASLSIDSQLVRTAAEAPVLVAVTATAPVDKCRQLAVAGVDIFPCAGATHAERFDSLLEELGNRRMTNVLVEGGGRLLGTLFEADLVDEVHVFTASKPAGGDTVRAPQGFEHRLTDPVVTELDGDRYLRGRIAR